MQRALSFVNEIDDVMSKESKTRRWHPLVTVLRGGGRGPQYGMHWLCPARVSSVLRVLYNFWHRCFWLFVTQRCRHRLVVGSVMQL